MKVKKQHLLTVFLATLMLVLSAFTIMFAAEKTAVAAVNTITLGGNGEPLQITFQTTGRIRPDKRTALGGYEITYFSNDSNGGVLHYTKGGSRVTAGYAYLGSGLTVESQELQYDGRTVKTVFSNADVELTRTVRYPENAYESYTTYQIKNISGQVLTDVSFAYGGDTKFGSADSGYSFYDAMNNSVYVTQSNTSGLMSLKGADNTPIDYYWAGSYWDGRNWAQSNSTVHYSFVVSENSSVLDNGYYVKWVTNELTVGNNWTVESVETISAPGVVMVHDLSNITLTQGMTKTAFFTFTNLNAIGTPAETVRFSIAGDGLVPEILAKNGVTEIGGGEYEVVVPARGSASIELSVTAAWDAQNSENDFAISARYGAGFAQTCSSDAKVFVSNLTSNMTLSEFYILDGVTEEGVTASIEINDIILRVEDYAFFASLTDSTGRIIGRIEFVVPSRSTQYVTQITIPADIANLAGDYYLRVGSVDLDVIGIYRLIRSQFFNLTKVVDEITEAPELYAEHQPLPIISKPGSALAGWYLESTYETKVEKMGSSDLTVYAKWVNEKTLSFDADGGTAVADRLVGIGLTTNLPSTTKSGYALGWWSLNSDGSGDKYYAGQDFVMGGADCTLYAQWVEEYTLTFDTNGGSSIASVEVGAGVPYELPISIKTGYINTGWNDGFGTSYEIGADDFYMADSNLILYAEWEAKKVTVSFDANWGVLGTASVVATYGLDMPAATAPTRAGYIFEGYFSTATDIKYYDNTMTSVKVSDFNANASLYAKWRLVGITAVSVSGSLNVVYNPSGSTTLTANATHPLSSTYGFTYQWYKGSTLLSGKTSSALVLTNVSESGDYYVAVSLSDGLLTNTVNSSTATVTIARAASVITTTGVQTNYTYTGVEQTVSGAALNHSEGTLVYTNNKFTNVGTGSQVVTISVAETANYAQASVNVTITIARAASVITITEAVTSYTYTGVEQTASITATLNHSEGAIVYTNNKFTNVGTGSQVVTISVAETANYAQASTTVTIYIARAVSIITTTDVQRNYTYTGAEQTVNSGATLNHGEGTIVYTNNKFTNVGTGSQVVTISVAETANYLATSTTVTIYIAKAKAIITTSGVEKNYIYTGAEQTVDSGAMLNHRETAIVYTNNKFTDVGIGLQAVIISVPETANYFATSRTVVIFISKAEAVITTTGVETNYTYTGEEQTVGGATLNHSESTLVYTNNKFTNVGTGLQEVTISAAESANYFAIDKIITISIARAASVITTTGVQTNYTYTGAEQTVNSGATLSHSGGTLVYTNNKFTDVGTGSQVVIISVAETANYLAASATVTITIAKVASIITTTGVETSYTYTGEEQAIDSGATLNHSGGTLVYTNNKFTNVGTGSQVVTISVAETENYFAASETVTISIAKAVSVITTTGVQTSYTYTGIEQTVNSGATLNHSGGTLVYTNNKFTNVGTGSQVVTISVAETENYLAASAKVTISIEKATAPAQPDASKLTTKEITKTSVTLSPIAGAEYKMNDGQWQDSNVFSDLDADTEYTFYVRIKGTDDVNNSAAAQTSFKTLENNNNKANLTWLWILIVIIAVCLLALFLFFIIKKKKKKEAESN